MSEYDDAQRFALRQQQQRKAQDLPPGVFVAVYGDPDDRLIEIHHPGTDLIEIDGALHADCVIHGDMPESGFDPEVLDQALRETGWKRVEPWDEGGTTLIARRELPGTAAEDFRG